MKHSSPAFSRKNGYIGSVRNFKKIIGVELDHTPKREIVPDDLTTLPKEKLSLMTYPTSVQIYKNY
jgi:hypothetical protein